VARVSLAVTASQRTLLLTELKHRFTFPSADAMRWYCPNLAAHPNGPKLIREVRFECHDLGTQLKPIIQGWVEDESVRKCTGEGGCGQTAGPRAVPGGLTNPNTQVAQ
jgi:hypothetical protein